MLLKMNHNEVHVLAPAKVNLHLELLRKRPDGFHDIETIMLAVDLYDSLQMIRRDDGIVSLDLRLPGQREKQGYSAQETKLAAATNNSSPSYARSIESGEKIGVQPTERSADNRNRSVDSSESDPAWVIPADSTNLVVRGLERLQSLLGIRQGVHVVLTKKIPAAAGLGGGSSDTAAALTAASLLWLGQFDRAAVEAVASQMGSDLSFFLGSAGQAESGIAFCSGRGEQVSQLTLGGRLHGVIAHPPVGCSTAEVYRRCRVPTEPRSADEMIAVLAEGRFENLPDLLCNRLEEAASLVTPWVERLRTWMNHSSAWCHQLSGSGSARFAVCRNAEEAKQLANDLIALGLQRVHTWQSCITPAIEVQLSLGSESH